MGLKIVKWCILPLLRYIAKNVESFGTTNRVFNFILTIISFDDILIFARKGVPHIILKMRDTLYAN